ncbi:MAG: Acetyltransferase [Legionella sp.]|uniref:GNAT family N-acetyltransferase n=1 Tax=Legionella sp. TaxID=459 RepID=UPI003D0E12FB
MKSQMNVLVKKISAAAEMQVCHAIRHQVFVKGQNVPLHEEVDGLDATSEHYLLFLNQQPAGTARVRYIDDFAKIERVAILDAYQGQGLGHVLMNFIIETLQKNQQVKKAKLGAQSYAIPFYEKLGFVVCSDEYLDAGIPHKDMQLSFKI